MIIAPPGYRDLSLCGSGATSRVYRAFDVRRKKVVALKRLNRQMVRSQDALARLKRELEALGRLRHENIVAVHDVIRWGGDPTIVMEYVPGEDLKAWSVHHGRPEFEELERIARVLFDALATAHGAGIIHRDVKPQNVRRTPEGRIVLLDFGSARLDATSELTQTGTSVGTPEYMPPELFVGSVYDPRVDIYGVGAVLFECLTGRPPQTADTLAELAFQRSRAAVESVTTLVPETPRPLAQVVDRCLAREPEDRYASATLAVWALDNPELDAAFTARRSTFPPCLHCHTPLPPEVAACPRCASDHPFSYAPGRAHVDLTSFEDAQRLLEHVAADFPEHASPTRLHALAERAGALSARRQRYISGIDEGEARALVERLQASGVRAEVKIEPRVASWFLPTAMLSALFVAEASLRRLWGALFSSESFTRGPEPDVSGLGWWMLAQVPLVFLAIFLLQSVLAYWGGRQSALNGAPGRKLVFSRTTATLHALFLVLAVLALATHLREYFAAAVGPLFLPLGIATLGGSAGFAYFCRFSRVMDPKTRVPSAHAVASIGLDLFYIVAVAALVLLVWPSELLAPWIFGLRSVLPLAAHGLLMASSLLLVGTHRGLLVGLVLHAAVLGTTREPHGLAAILGAAGLFVAARLAAGLRGALPSAEPSLRAALWDRRTFAQDERSGSVHEITHLAYLLIFLALVPIEISALEEFLVRAPRPIASDSAPSGPKPDAMSDGTPEPLSGRRPQAARAQPGRPGSAPRSVAPSPIVPGTAALALLPLAFVIGVRRVRRRVERDGAQLFAELDLSTFAALAARPVPQRAPRTGPDSAVDGLAAIEGGDPFTRDAVRRAVALGHCLSRASVERLSTALEALRERTPHQPASERSLLARCIQETEPAQRLCFEFLALEAELEREAATTWANTLGLAPKPTLRVPSPEVSPATSASDVSETAVARSEPSDGIEASGETVESATATEGLIVSELPIGLRIAGRYLIREKLGDGAVASVYRAFDETLNEAVALKVLDPLRAIDPVARGRFEREFEALSRVTSTGVARAFRRETHGDLEVLVLELVEGETLADRLARGRLPVEEAVKIAEALARALDACHAAGILHRDLKPANVMLHPERGPVVLDFGTAWFSSAASLTRTGAVVGSPQYLAPEVFRASLADARADVYALGVIFFEMLTGRPVHLADNVAELATLHLETAPVSVSTLRPSVDAALSAIVDHAIAPEPEARFATARELLDALSRRRPALGAKLQPRIRCRTCRTPLIVDLELCPGCGLAVAWRLTSGPYAVQLTGALDALEVVRWLVRRHPRAMKFGPRAARRRLSRMPAPLVIGASWASAEQLAAEAKQAGAEVEIVRARAFLGERVRAAPATVLEMSGAALLHLGVTLFVGSQVARVFHSPLAVASTPLAVAVMGVLVAVFIARRPLLRAEEQPRLGARAKSLERVRAQLSALTTDRGRRLAAGAVARAAPVWLEAHGPFSTALIAEVEIELAAALEAAGQVDAHAALLLARSRARLASEVLEVQARLERTPDDLEAAARLSALEVERVELFEASLAHDVAAARALEASSAISRALATERAERSL